jgi:hypothetical protein
MQEYPKSGGSGSTPSSRTSQRQVVQDELTKIESAVQNIRSVTAPSPEAEPSGTSAGWCWNPGVSIG